jgi:hypothetical protein
MKHRSTAGLAGLVLALLLAAPAAAAPVTVDLRIEGANATLFEGKVTTDVRGFRFTGDPVEHVCDGTSVNGGPSSVPVPTRGAALSEASERTPFAMMGTWSTQFGGAPVFSQVFGENVAYNATTQRYFAEFKRGKPSDFGACGDPIETGDEVVFAYAKFGDVVLKLSGPATARPGDQVSVRVTDAADGDAVSGATVAGVTTVGDGRATVGPFAAGEHVLQATRADSVRSNRLRLCVTSGSDGACGSPLLSPPDTTAPTATIDGIRAGQRFTRRRAPRELSGTVSSDPSGLWAVKIRLTRRYKGTCWYFSGSREQFLKRTCGKQYAFKVGDRAEWSYLLPARLPRGRYVLSTYAIDNAFNRGEESRLVFRVR